MAFAKWCGYSAEQIKANKFRFKYDELGRYILQKEGIKLVDGEQGQLMRYCYKGPLTGTYIPEFMGAAWGIYPYLTAAANRKVNNYLNPHKAVEGQRATFAPPEYMAFANGVYNLETDKLIPFTPELVIANKVPWDYDPNAKSALLDSCLDQWSNGDPAVRTLLLEMVGYTLYRANTLHKAFILYSPYTRTGKSTFLRLVHDMLGCDNCCYLSLSDMTIIFKKALLANTLACIEHEISGRLVTKSKLINSLLYSEMQQAKFKREPLFDFKPYAKLLSATTDLDCLQNSSKVLLDSLIVIPFYHQFAVNLSFLGKLEEERPALCKALIAASIRAFKEVLKRNAFTHRIAQNGAKHQGLPKTCLNRVNRPLLY